MALGERIVNMYEAAFRGFNMVKSQRIWHTAELEAAWVIKRSRVEDHDSIPTALHRYRVA